MPRQKVRVILASENPEVQYFLRGIIEEEEGAVIIGQAENAIKALTLARTLRPDVALIDFHLPHAVGLDTVALSRVGGLDTAQTISDEIPNTRVVLLSNLDTTILSQRHLGSDVSVILSLEGRGASSQLALSDLYQMVAEPNVLLFASIEAKPRASRGDILVRPGPEDMVFAGLGVIGGLSLILTLVLMKAWLILAIAVATAIGVSIGLLWHRAKLWRAKRTL